MVHFLRRVYFAIIHLGIFLTVALICIRLYNMYIYIVIFFASACFVSFHLGIFMTVAARREGRMYASDLPGRSCTWDTDNVLDNDNG